MIKLLSSSLTWNYFPLCLSCTINSCWTSQIWGFQRGPLWTIFNFYLFLTHFSLPVKWVSALRQWTVNPRFVLLWEFDLSKTFLTLQPWDLFASISSFSNGSPPGSENLDRFTITVYVRDSPPPQKPVHHHHHCNSYPLSLTALPHLDLSRD